VRFVAGEEAGDQRTQAQTADVRDRPHDPGPPSRPAARHCVEIGDERRRSGDRGANAKAREYSREDQASE
jgi:hypothetical protein